MNIENNIFCLIYNIFDNIKVCYIFLILILYIYNLIYIIYVQKK